MRIANTSRIELTNFTNMKIKLFNELMTYDDNEAKEAYAMFIDKFSTL